MTAHPSKTISRFPLPLVAFCAVLGITSPAVKGAVTLLMPTYPRFIFSSLGIMIAVLMMTLVSVRIRVIIKDSVVRFAALFVVIVLIHYLVMNDDDLVVQFKTLLQYKLLTGLGTTVLMYIMARQLIFLGQSRLLRCVMGAWFFFLLVLNLTILIVGVLGLAHVSNVQILENNRAAFELFAVGLVWTSLSMSGGLHGVSWLRLGTTRQAALIAITLISMAFSTRSVQLAVLIWLTVLIWRGAVIDRAKLRRLIVPIVIAALLGSAIVHSPLNVVRISMVKATTPELRHALEDKPRAISLERNKIAAPYLDLMQRFTPESFEGSDLMVIPKSAISTVSRIVQIVDAMRSLVGTPMGKGYTLDRDKVLGFSNHSLFFILIEVYGVFWVMFSVGAAVAWRRMHSHWLLLLPLGVNMLFMSNVMAASLLAFSVCPRGDE